MIGQLVFAVTTAAGPAAPVPAVVRVLHAHAVLPAGRAAARRIEAPPQESFLIVQTEGKRLVALHAKQDLIVHHTFPC
jgi:hypothetical protein